MFGLRLQRVALLLFAVVPAWAFGAYSTAVVDVESRPLVLQRFLYLKPDNPVANIIVFPGGPGVLQIQSNGVIQQEAEQAFPLRAASLLASQGYAVALVDAPSDRLNALGLNNFRKSRDHLTDMTAVSNYLRQQANVPLWLVGHSYGSISAVSVGLNLPQAQPIGLVLVVPPTVTTSAVPGGNSLLEEDLSGLRRPTLIVYHPADMCPTSPPANVPQLVAKLKDQPVLEVLSFIGGSSPEPFGPCPGASYHGFNEIEVEVGAAIGEWISEHNALLGGSPATIALAVEYYRAGADHYFVSSLLPDIAALGSGRLAGWAPTKQSFRVHGSPAPGANPVCRFYIPPGRGDSHFYSASPQECAETQAKFPFFDFESPSVFYIGLPDAVTGDCPAGSVPVFRVWNTRVDSNHRYTTSLAIRDQMVASGWLAEGYGPAQVIMCAPT